MRSLGPAGASALAADVVAPASPGGDALNGRSLESGGVVIHVVIEPLARCASSCAGELPATGGVLPSVAWWAAVALLATGLLLVLRRRRVASGDVARQSWERSYPYDVVIGRQAGAARFDGHFPVITNAAPAAADRDSERGDP